MLLLLLMPAQCMMVRAAAVLGFAPLGQAVSTSRVCFGGTCAAVSGVRSMFSLQCILAAGSAGAVVVGCCSTARLISGRQAGLVCQLSCDTCMAAAALVCCPGVVGPSVHCLCCFTPGLCSVLLCSWPAPPPSPADYLQLGRQFGGPSGCVLVPGHVCAAAA